MVELTLNKYAEIHAGHEQQTFAISAVRI